MGDDTYTRHEKALFVVSGLLVVGTFLDWISVSEGSASGLDSVYGQMVLAIGLLLGYLAYSRKIRELPSFLEVFAGLTSLGMLWMYFSSIEDPEETVPTKTASLPDGTTGPWGSMEFEVGFVLVGFVALALIAVGVLRGLGRGLGAVRSAGE